jgi:glycosyltransferase involved in cell wall biosynthesis
MLNNCDVLAFTSLFEATSTTVMQSLSLGVPVICLKHCGFGDVVNHECGVTIPVTRPLAVIDGFASAIHLLIKNPDKVRSLSEGACRRAIRYSWDNLAVQLKNSYEFVLLSSIKDDEKSTTVLN